jgi:hypothetical protein
VNDVPHHREDAIVMEAPMEYSLAILEEMRSWALAPEDEDDVTEDDEDDDEDDFDEDDEDADGEEEDTETA